MPRVLLRAEERDKGLGDDVLFLGLGFTDIATLLGSRALRSADGRFLTRGAGTADRLELGMASGGTENARGEIRGIVFAGNPTNGKLDACGKRMSTNPAASGQKIG